MKPSSRDAAVAKAPVGSSGRFGDLGGTGGGTRVLDPGGLSHSTAGRFRVSVAGSSAAAASERGLASDEEPSGETEPDMGFAGTPEVGVAPSGE
jgi:hypothetical protein